MPKLYWNNHIIDDYYKKYPDHLSYTIKLLLHQISMVVKNNFINNMIRTNMSESNVLKEVEDEYMVEHMAGSIGKVDELKENVIYSYILSSSGFPH
jgi:hypothetical protein